MGMVDAVWCLGDIVGYGPWPNECINLLRERTSAVIAGNHDLATVGSQLVSVEDFNPDAAAATHWTASQLTPESRSYLEGLEPKRTVEGVTLAHGSPRHPVWEYLMTAAGAAASFEQLDTTVCLIGHTHIPSIFIEQEDGEIGVVYMEADSRLEPGEQRCIANPGSVGQPRDRDPRAAYLLLELGNGGPALEWRRVTYDIGAVQAEMRRVGLPRFFIERLEYGV
jgi:diadenosine tetraphosphatase ApaH/serine/threonine PP2A family protein phosphatase